MSHLLECQLAVSVLCHSEDCLAGPKSRLQQHSLGALRSLGSTARVQYIGNYCFEFVVGWNQKFWGRNFMSGQDQKTQCPRFNIMSGQVFLDILRFPNHALWKKLTWSESGGNLPFPTKFWRPSVHSVDVSGFEDVYLLSRKDKYVVKAIIGNKQI